MSLVMEGWWRIVPAGALVLAGCNCDTSFEFPSIGSSDPETDTQPTAGSSGSGTETDSRGPDMSNSGNPMGGGCAKLDMLFVLDDSPDMIDEQVALRDSYGAFTDALEAEGMVDYHAALTRANMDPCGADYGGSFHWLPSECLPNPLKYVIGPSPLSVAAFQCLADVISFSFSAQPLQAGFSALVDRVLDGTNPGEFRRPDAFLLVFFITDRDDHSGLPSVSDACAEEPIDFYVDRYNTSVLRGDPTAAAFVALAGPAEGGCTDAGPAPRLHEFMAAWDGHGYVGDLCGGDFEAALLGAIPTIASACGAFDPEDG